MSAALAALVAAALLAQTRTSTSAAHPVEGGTHTSSAAAMLGNQPLSVHADRLVAQPKRGIFAAEGHVLLVRPELIVRADRVVFDQGAKTATAEGHVAIVEGSSVLFCKRVEMKLPGMLGDVSHAELRIKAGIPAELREALDAEQLRTYGKDELILTARDVERTGPRSLSIHGGAFTACDCGVDEAPTWEIDASSASIDLDSGAWLTWPVFYAKGVPFFVLPAFYVPLGERRTGLLMPHLGHNAVTGFRVSEPLFLTLGESWDATLEAGFMFDRGPSSALELRWAPSETSRGVLRAALLFDYGTPDGAGGFTRAREDPLERFAISGRHESQLGEGAKLAADLNLTGDPAYVAELADAYLSRQAESISSRITITSLSDRTGVRVAGGLALMEDLRPIWYAPAPDLRAVQLFSSAVPGAGEVRQRFAELRLDAPPYPLLAKDSPLLGEARLVVHAFAAPSPELARFVRADLRPQISLPISLFDALVLEPSLAGRFTAWAGRFEHEDASATRFGLIAQAALFTELGRSYGSLIHRLRPELDYLLIPYVERRGSTAFANEDEIDLLAAVSQVRAKLTTDLLDASTGQRRAMLEAWMGRDLGLPGGAEGAGTSELVLRGEVELALGELRLVVDGRSAIAVEPSAEVSELVAGFTLAGRAGNALAVHYGTFGDRVPRNGFLAEEELTPSHTIDTSVYVPLARVMGSRELLPWSPYRGVELGLQLHQDLPGKWGRATLSSGVNLIFDRAEDRPAAVHGPEFVRNTQTLLRWDSSCDCFGVGAVVATARDRPGFDLVGVVIDLARFGQVSAR